LYFFEFQTSISSIAFWVSSGQDQPSDSDPFVTAHKYPSITLLRFSKVRSFEVMLGSLDFSSVSKGSRMVKFEEASEA